MQVTVNIPDDMARQLESVEDNLPHILALGLQQIQANPSKGFTGLVEVIEFLTKLPSPEETLELQLSDVAQAQVELLLDKNREGTLTPLDKKLWQQYEFVEHLVRIAKAGTGSA